MIWWSQTGPETDSLSNNDDDESDETHKHIMNQDDQYSSEWSEESDDSQNDG